MYQRDEPSQVIVIVNVRFSQVADYHGPMTNLAKHIFVIQERHKDAQSAGYRRDGRLRLHLIE